MIIRVYQILILSKLSVKIIINNELPGCQYSWGSMQFLPQLDVRAKSTQEKPTLMPGLPAKVHNDWLWGLNHQRIVLSTRTVQGWRPEGPSS